jgi:hypothetical protein
MNSRAGILSCILFAVTPLTAREKTDVIVMKNGDRLTGEIKGLSNGVLRFDLDYVDGALSVQWSKVARLESKQLFILQTEDGVMHTGTLITDPVRTDHIRVEGVEEEALIEQGRVVRVEETSQSFLRRWSGEVSIGAVYTKGNNATQYNLGTDAEYRRERWGAQVVVSSNLSANTGSDTSTRNELTISGYRLLPWRNYFYGGLADFLQSSVQGINRQNTIGGGIGRYLKNSSRIRISLLGGVAWQTADYTGSTVEAPTTQVAAGLLATSVKLFVFKKTNLNLSANLIPAINDGGRVHFTMNTIYALKLFSNFWWNLSFYGNWDTRPPANFSGSDYGYSSGIKWTFGYR